MRKKTLILFVFIIVLTAITLVGCTHKHVWGELQITKEATCTEEGIMTRTCGDDVAHTETKPYQKEEHTHSVKYYGDGDFLDDQPVICGIKTEPLVVEIDGNPTFDWYIANDLSGEPFDFYSNNITSDLLLYTSIYSDGLSFNLQDDDTYSVSLGAFEGQHVIVPTMFSGKPVTAIADRGFLDAINITSVYLPPNITKLGFESFKGCVVLDTFNYEGGISVIGSGAFRECVKLTEFTVSDTIEEINPNAFWGCEALETVKISNTSILESIYDMSFYGCEKLKTINIPSSIKYLGDFAFYGCAELSNVNIPQGIEFVGNGVFDGTLWFNALDGEFKIIANTLIKYNGANNGESVTVPSQVTKIGAKVFQGKNITTITLPENLEFLGDFGFANSKITSIVLPNKIKFIPYNAFEGCTDLLTVMFAPDSTVERIMEDSFSGCDKLTSICIPKSVKEIGASAFAGCAALQSCEFEDESALTEIHFFAFDGCVKLNNIVLPDSVQFIDGNVFDGCTVLTNITFGTGIGSIHNWAFNDCVALVKITMTSLLPPIITGGGLFSSSVGEITITVPVGAAQAYQEALRWNEYSTKIVEVAI